MLFNVPEYSGCCKPVDITIDQFFNLLRFTSFYNQVSVATFATYVLLGNTLTASKAFVALALFNIIRFPMTALPWMLMNVIQVRSFCHKGTT